MKRSEHIQKIFIIEFSPKDREDWKSTVYDPFFDDEDGAKNELGVLNRPDRFYRYRYVEFNRQEPSS